MTDKELTDADDAHAEAAHTDGAGAGAADKGGAVGGDAGAAEGAGEAKGSGSRIARGRLILSAALGALLLATGAGYAAVSCSAPEDFRQSARADESGGDSEAGDEPRVDKPGESCVDDPASDLAGQGKLPSYAEIVTVCLREVGDRLRLELTADGDLPERMPNKSTVVTFGFEFSDTAGGYTHVFVQGNHKGWTAFLSSGQERADLSKRLTVEDRILRVALKSSDLASLALAEKPRLEWKVEASWTGSSDGEVSYAFDAAPNLGHAPFRRTTS